MKSVDKLGIYRHKDLTKHAMTCNGGDSTRHRALEASSPSPSFRLSKYHFG